MWRKPDGVVVIPEEVLREGEEEDGMVYWILLWLMSTELYQTAEG